MSDNSLASKHVGIIGAGAMGGAIACGLVEAGALQPNQVLICDHNAAKLSNLKDKCGVCTYASAEEVLAATPDVVILAIKPQVLGGFIEAHTEELSTPLVISIAAGVSLAVLESTLCSSRVVRVMPNLPVAVRSGASAICRGTRASEADVALASELFGALGAAVVMREDQLDTEGAVVGCGPAYFALMVDALTRAAVKNGLKASDAREMVNATMLGVARMLSTGEVHPREYMERVTSPGGTTAAALYELEPALTDGVYAAVDAALERTRELAGE